MEFRFQELVLEADTARTRALYAALGDVTASCSCPGCRNYLRARDFLPRTVLDFFHALGIDPGKAAEVYPWCAEQEGRALYYGGFYHLCGSLLQGEDCWREGGEMNTAGMIALAEGYSSLKSALSRLFIKKRGSSFAISLANNSSVSATLC